METESAVKEEKPPVELYRTGSIYTLDAELIDGAKMPGVYSVKAIPGDSIASGATIGIPSVAKQNLENGPTKELPAIVMGAAVNHEVRTGATEFTPFASGDRIAPYSYFRYGILDEQMKNIDGTITTHKKMSGFDGTYYIVRVDVSDIIKGHGEGEYLHVKQESNKALMVAMGMSGTTYSDALGNKTGSYSLADNAAALKDTGAGDIDKDTTYFDVIVLSSGKIVAGADAGKTDAPAADIKLSFYVEDQVQYNELEELSTTNPPTFPYTVNGVTYQLETDYNKALLDKFFSDEKATSENTATSYLVKGSDLEIDVAIDEGSPVKVDNTKDGKSFDSTSVKSDSTGIKWIDGNYDFWSLTKAIDHSEYDDHTIILICEVPVLEGLNITGSGKKRSVVLDVNSFDIQIANSTEKNTAGLVIGADAQLRIMDNSNTSGAELAIGNNATMVIKKGGVLIVDETCTNEVEYDAATAVDPAMADTSMMNGAITVEDGGQIINYGVINVEGTESKPQAPNAGEQQQGQTVITDKKSADLTVYSGGILDNYGCISLKGVLYMLGTLNNYGKYNENIVAYDPDKGSTSYHKGIQLTWKDIVTDEGVEPGILNVGIDADGNIEKNVVINNYGDIVLVPGTVNLYGSFNNLGDDAHLYMCDPDEAIIPVTPTPEDPLTVEKKVTLDPPKQSVFNNKGKLNALKEKAKVELVHNGVLGTLTPLTDESKSVLANATDGNDMVLVSEIDSLDYSEVGFILEADGKRAVRSTKTVYSEIDESAYTLKNFEGGKYLYSFIIEDISDETKEIKVTPFSVDLNGVKATGATQSFRLSELKTLTSFELSEYMAVALSHQEDAVIDDDKKRMRGAEE